MKATHCKTSSLLVLLAAEVRGPVRLGARMQSLTETLLSVTEPAPLVKEEAYSANEWKPHPSWPEWRYVNMCVCLYINQNYHQITRDICMPTLKYISAQTCICVHAFSFLHASISWLWLPRRLEAMALSEQ